MSKYFFTTIKAEIAPTPIPKPNCINTKIHQLVKKYENPLNPGKTTDILGDKK